MRDTDMIEAMARAMEGHGSLQGAATAALAVVQPEIDRLRKERDDLSGELSIWKSVFPDIAPRNVLPDRSNLEYELDRLRAENVELSHREKVRSEAINRALTCQRELAEEARSVADLANKLFDQREEYLSGLNARNAELSAENARLRSALEPFASRAGRYDPVDNDDGEPDWSTAAPSIRIGDLRRARAALSPSPADREGR